MKFAIIAAGEGSRLAAEGIAAPKPLVTVAGERLIDRLMRIFLANGAEEIVVICNDMTDKVSGHLRDVERNGLYGKAVPLRFVVKSTPSSMHSFFEISGMLGDSPFCLTTVDTIFREDDFGQYVAAFKEAVAAGRVDGLMGVTDYVDDEKPLYVETDGRMNITAFLDASDSCKYISGGIYGLTPAAITTLRGCMDRGESRMRNFQRALLADGLRLEAWPFTKVLDIDHASDISKAEAFVKEGWSEVSERRSLTVNPTQAKRSAWHMDGMPVAARRDANSLPFNGCASLRAASSTHQPSVHSAHGYQ